MYDKGKGVPQSDKEAVKWCRKAAEHGHAKAQSNLGIMYRKGLGVLQSDKEAVKWYQKAADQGSADAQCNLGITYADGRGLPQSDKEAVKWYQKAAEQGHAGAQYNLGYMYDKGRGVPQSDKEAFQVSRPAFSPRTRPCMRSKRLRSTMNCTLTSPDSVVSPQSQRAQFSIAFILPGSTHAAGSR